MIKLSQVYSHPLSSQNIDRHDTERVHGMHFCCLATMHIVNINVIMISQKGEYSNHDHI